MSVKHLPSVWAMLAGVLLVACPGVGLIVAPSLPLWLHAFGVVLVVWGSQVVVDSSHRFLAIPLPPRTERGRHKQVWRHRRERSALLTP